MLPKAIVVVFLAAAALVAVGFWSERPHPETITIAYSAVTGPSWPFYIAKEGGYYARYGLDVNLAYAVHPAEIAMVISGQAAMASCGLEQAMEASSRDGSLVVYASPFKKSLLALMAQPQFRSVRELKGKRIGVSQLGDTPYSYTVGLLERSGLNPREVQWVGAGASGSGRAAALESGRVDATLVSAPAYFRLEDRGYRNLANISDFEDLYAPAVFLFKKAFIVEHPQLPEQLIRAHAEAIKRLYEDKDFAIRAYMRYNHEDVAAVKRTLELYSKAEVYERTPYIIRPAVEYMLAHPIDERSGAIMKNFNFQTVLDNSVVDRLAGENFFEELFGPAVRKEQEQKRKIAFR